MFTLDVTEMAIPYLRTRDSCIKFCAAASCRRMCQRGDEERSDGRAHRSWLALAICPESDSLITASRRREVLFDFPSHRGQLPGQ